MLNVLYYRLMCVSVCVCVPALVRRRGTLVPKLSMLRERERARERARERERARARERELNRRERDTEIQRRRVWVITCLIDSEVAWEPCGIPLGFT